ncbi:MAG: sigma-70 family RNA polymerase sigma factor [Clostridia bacterium]|nr:sigma-70 family RNA polymerase sigma factor [Clostridia bacterium]
MVDEKEFEELINKYRSELYVYCFAYSEGEKDVADDAFSDMLSVVFNKWDELEKGPALRVYLYNVVRLCVKNRRKKKSKYYKRISSLEEAIETNTFTEIGSLDTYFEDNTPVEEYISKVLSELTDEEAELFRLKYIEKRNLKDIEKLKELPYYILRYRYIKLENRVREIIKKFF